MVRLGLVRLGLLRFAGTAGPRARVSSDIPARSLSAAAYLPSVCWIDGWAAASATCRVSAICAARRSSPLAISERRSVFCTERDLPVAVSSATAFSCSSFHGLLHIVRLHLELLGFRGNSLRNGLGVAHHANGRGEDEDEAVGLLGGLGHGMGACGPVASTGLVPAIALSNSKDYNHYALGVMA